MLPGIGNGHVNQGVPFFVGHLGGVANFHQAIGIVAALMADGDADVHVLADIARSDVLLVDLEAHVVVDVVSLAQLDGILAVARFARHEGHSVRRIVVNIGFKGSLFPGEVVRVIQLDQAEGVCAFALRIHLDPAMLGVVWDLGAVVAQGVLVQSHVIVNDRLALGSCPGNGNQRPALDGFPGFVPDPGAHVIPAAKRRVGIGQRVAGLIIGVDIDQVGVLPDGVHDIRSVRILDEIIACRGGEGVIIQAQRAVVIIRNLRQVAVPACFQFA